MGRRLLCFGLPSTHGAPGADSCTCARRLRKATVRTGAGRCTWLGKALRQGGHERVCAKRGAQPREVRAAALQARARRLCTRQQHASGIRTGVVCKSGSTQSDTFAQTSICENRAWP